MSAMSKLMDAVNKSKAQQGGSKFQDPHADKFWKAEPDSSGNAYAVIRFLPGKTEDDIPFVKTYSHGFKNDAGRWFIENCPTTVGETCPCCEANGPLWNSGIEKDKEIVRQRKRKVAYISNILVVSDSKNPDNEGKVFLFKYGQKIFDKVVGALTPEFEDEQPLNPFDAKEGANFKLKMRKVDGYANFDKSEFDAASAIKDKKALDQIHDLAVFTSKSEFKSYDELKKKFDLIVGNNGMKAAPKSAIEDDDDSFVREQVKVAKKATPTAKKDDNDEDDLSYFSRLANEE